MKKGRTTVFFLIADLKFARFNSKRRNELKQMGRLRRTIEEHGLLSPILLCNDSATIHDGHRRATIYEELGHTEIECLVTDLDPKKNWGAANAGAKPHDGHDWLFAAWKGASLSEAPPALKNKIAAVMEIFGREEVHSLLLERGLGPGVIDAIRRVEAEIKGFPDLGIIQPAVIGRWIVTYKAQFVLRAIDQIKDGLILARGEKDKDRARRAFKEKIEDLHRRIMSNIGPKDPENVVPIHPSESCIDYLKANGLGDVAAMIRSVERKLKASGKETRRNWWDVLAGDSKGRPRTIVGVTFPVLAAAQRRQKRLIKSRAKAS